MYNLGFCRRVVSALLQQASPVDVEQAWLTLSVDSILTLKYKQNISAMLSQNSGGIFSCLGW